MSTGVIYARYSSHAQREVSIDQQVKECRKFAERQGVEIVTVYDDRAMTGTNDRRPMFQKMIRDAKKADWEYVVVYTLDRFARDRYDSAVYKRELKTCGVRVLSAMENISDDPTGILMESLLEGLAEYYSKELSRKVQRGMNDNAERCVVNGKPPYGYCRGKDGRYEMVPEEAQIVREIFQRVLDGDAITDIQRDLSNRPAVSERRKDWGKSSFNSILQNERYTGVYIYGDIRIEGGMPLIVPRDLYDAVQHKLVNKKNPRNPQLRRRANGTYLLTGKIFCGACNSPMIGMSGTSKSAELHRYYVCKGHRVRHTCRKKPIKQDRIEREVAQAIKKYVLTDEAILFLADYCVERQKTMSRSSATELLEKELEAVQKSLRNIVLAIEQGIVSTSTQARLQELEHQERDLIGKIASERICDEDISRDEIIALLKLYQDGCVDDKDYQEVLFNTFLIAVYVYDDRLRVVFNVGRKSTEEVDIFPDDANTDDDPDGVRLSDCLGHQNNEALYHYDTGLFLVFMRVCGFSTFRF